MWFYCVGENPCVACAGGYYSSVEQTMLLTQEVIYYDDYCTGCEEGTYSTATAAYGTEGSVCIPCTYPYTTPSSGSDVCSCVDIATSTVVIVLLFVLAGLSFFILVFNYEMRNRVAVLLVFVFPFMDTLTNIAYILTSKFYNMATFVCCVLFCCHAIPMFMYSVYQLHATPSISGYIWWLGYSTSAREAVLAKEVKNREQRAGQRLQGGEEGGTPGTAAVTVDASGSGEAEAEEGDHIPYPTIFRYRIGFLFDLTLHDSIFALFLELLYWVLAIAAQGLSLILVPLFFLCWFLYGCALQMTKFITISSLYNNWFQVWTSTDECDDVGSGGVDTEELNYYLLCQFVLETLPMIIIQSINNSLLHAWVSSPFAIFSFIMSIVMLLNVLYKYMFQSYLLASPNKMKNIPIDRTLRINIPWLRINVVIVNGKLEPYSKRLRCHGYTSLNQSLLPLDEDEEGDEGVKVNTGKDNSASTYANTAPVAVPVSGNSVPVGATNASKPAVASSFGKNFAI